jgi:hypothetical protein
LWAMRLDWPVPQVSIEAYRLVYAPCDMPRASASISWSVLPAGRLEIYCNGSRVVWTHSDFAEQIGQLPHLWFSHKQETINV